MSRNVLQTQVAGQAVTFADAFNMRMRELRLGSSGYVPDLTAPEGPSTGGGAQARQSIRLLPADAGAPTLVVGFVNCHTKEGELRTFEYVTSIYRERAGRALPFSAADYAAFLQAAGGFLAGEGIAVATTSLPPPSRADAQSSGGGSRGPLVVLTVIGGILVTAGAVLWMLMTKKP